MKATKLGAILLEAGKVTEAQLEAAVRSRGAAAQPLGEVLVELGFLGAADIAEALAQQLDIPFVAPDEGFRLEPEEVGLIPLSVARRYDLFAMKRNGAAGFTVVMSDPLDVEALDTVRSLTPLDVRRAVSTRAHIRSVIERFYRPDAHIERSLQDIVALEAPAGADAAGAARLDVDQLKVLANDAPVIKFVNLLLMQAVRDRASDIHFEPAERGVTVRLRVDGVLREVTPPPRSLYQAIVTRIKILSQMDITERRLPLDGRFKYKANDHEVDVRVSSLPEVFGEKLVLRILDKQSQLVELHEIGFEEATLERFRRILRRPHGIILLTGPTGSGKTTTLYSALNFLKSPEKNIQTVEDPVEYLIPGVNQMPIRPKIHLDFANSLRAILRQDPNIIMIGEIRDAETARIAMQASLTGHLVLSTLHTNDAPSAVSRLQDIGIEPYLIVATLNLVISQRLVRVLCPECKEERRPDPEAYGLAVRECPAAAGWTFHEARGCHRCGQAGYRGRQAIFEFLEITEPLRRMILEGADIAAFRRRAIELGMRTLMADGLDRVRQGITSVGEVLKVAALTEGL